ncbi:BRCT domain-containing protein [Pradoshia sp.]
MYVDKLMEIEERIVWLRNQLTEMSPSGEEYAVLYSELEKWEKSYPEFITAESPTQKDTDDFDGEISLPITRKVKEITGQVKLTDYLSRIDQSVFMQLLPKGIEVELHYENGRLQYACTANESANGKYVSAILAFSQDVPRFISYEGALSVRGCLFYTASFLEVHPEFEWLSDDADREVQRNRRVMVFHTSSLQVDLPMLEKLGFLIPYHHVYRPDAFQNLIHDCAALYAFDSGYELEGVLLSVGKEELLYRPRQSIQNRLDGKTIVITGVLSKRRYDFRKDIEALGGTLAGTVTNRVDFLLMGTNGIGTTKYQKAVKLGLPIMTEEQFKEQYDVK